MGVAKLQHCILCQNDEERVCVEDSDARTHSKSVQIGKKPSPTACFLLPHCLFKPEICVITASKNRIKTSKEGLTQGFRLIESSKYPSKLAKFSPAHPIFFSPLPENPCKSSVLTTWSANSTRSSMILPRYAGAADEIQRLSRWAGKNLPSSPANSRGSGMNLLCFSLFFLPPPARIHAQIAHHHFPHRRRILNGGRLASWMVAKNDTSLEIENKPLSRVLWMIYYYK